MENLCIYCFTWIGLSSCSNEIEEETDHKSEVEIYNEKATLLIEKIISRREDCSCLVLNSTEKQMEEMELGVSREELQEMIIKELDFASADELESAMHISTDFQLKNSKIDPSIKIWSRSTYDSLLIKGYEDNLKGLLKHRLDVIRKMCPKWVLMVSKPIFDTNYKYALVDIQNEGNCLKMPFFIYNLEGKSRNR